METAKNQPRSSGPHPRAPHLDVIRGVVRAKREVHQIIASEAGNFIVPAYPGLIVKDSYWRWPERDLAGNAIDFNGQVLGLSFDDAMHQLTGSQSSHCRRNLLTMPARPKAGTPVKSRPYDASAASFTTPRKFATATDSHRPSHPRIFTNFQNSASPDNSCSFSEFKCRADSKAILHEFWMEETNSCFGFLARFQFVKTCEVYHTIGLEAAKIEWRAVTGGYGHMSSRCSRK